MFLNISAIAVQPESLIGCYFFDAVFINSNKFNKFIGLNF
jgi:hypothetical protein